MNLSYLWLSRSRINAVFICFLCSVLAIYNVDSVLTAGGTTKFGRSFRVTKIPFVLVQLHLHLQDSLACLLPHCTDERTNNATSMQSINRFLYGPTPEERVRTWQTKLRAESRNLDREMRQVRVCRSVEGYAIEDMC